MREIVVYNTVILSHNLDSWIISCGHCRGSGIEPTYRERNCCSCEGTGHRKLSLSGDADSSENWNVCKCAHCNGSGTEPTYVEKVCCACDGIGAQLGIFPRVICGHCAGSGTEPTYTERMCNVCYGRGSIVLVI